MNLDRAPQVIQMHTLLKREEPAGSYPWLISGITGSHPEILSQLDLESGLAILCFKSNSIGSVVLLM